jgi:hypothetical protein
MKSISAQSLDEHLWKQRVVLIFSPDFQSGKGRDQLSIFKKEKEGLEDRRLIVYQITPEKAVKGTLPIDNPDFIKKMYQRFAVPKNNFMVVLIGLDGGKKLKQSKLLTTEELFAIIDGMPMRRSELRSRENNK